MCIFVCIFYINNTAKGNTSRMLNKLLHNAEYLQCLPYTGLKSFEVFDVLPPFADFYLVLQ